MKVLTTIKMIACFAVAGLLWAAPAGATLVSYEASATSLGGEAWSSLTVSLPKFDGSLGTLDSVTLTLAGNQSGTQTAATDLRNTSPMNWSYTGAISIEKYGLSSEWNVGGKVAVPATALASSRSICIMLPSFSPSIDSKTLSGHDVLHFEGNGDLIFTAKLQDDFKYLTSGVSGNPRIVGEPDGFKVTVTYNYTPVPEPGTVAAGVLVALPLGISVVRILRRSKAGSVK